MAALVRRLGPLGLHPLRQGAQPAQFADGQARRVRELTMMYSARPQHRLSVTAPPVGLRLGGLHVDAQRGH